MKIVSYNEQKQKEMKKNKQTLWDTIKHTNLCTMRKEKHT